MKKLHYSIMIDAPVKKVWHAMLDPEPYQEWTTAFNPGSYYQGSWEKGAKILFLGPDPETGKEGGMVARIAENKPYQYISIEHVGIINDGVEDFTSDDVKKWTPAFENYTFTEKNGKTEVVVDMDADEEHADMFNTMWPEGLRKLKAIAEQSEEP